MTRPKSRPQPAPAPSAPARKDGCGCQGGACPCCGCQAAAEATGDPATNGVDASKIGTAPSYRHCGRAVTRREAWDILQGRLVDDSAWLRLTVIGTPDATRQAAEDWSQHPALAPYRDKVLFQAYRPDDPLISGLGFAAGSPSVYVQRPDGRVLFRQASYPGAEQLAGALRKADPSYDPARDPDGKPAPQPPSQPDRPGLPFDLTYTQAGLLALGAALVILLFQRKAPQ